MDDHAGQRSTPDGVRQRRRAARAARVGEDGTDPERTLRPTELSCPDTGDGGRRTRIPWTTALLAMLREHGQGGTTISRRDRAPAHVAAQPQPNPSVGRNMVRGQEGANTSGIFSGLQGVA